MFSMETQSHDFEIQPITKNDRTFEAKRSKTAILHITRYLFIILFYIIIIIYLFIIYMSYIYIYIFVLC
jgi:hypothetical protein